MAYHSDEIHLDIGFSITSLMSMHVVYLRKPRRSTFKKRKYFLFRYYEKTNS